MDEHSEAPTALVADAPLISVRDLRVTYKTNGLPVPAARGISFDVRPGEVLTLVGESASGKSTIAHAILGLLPDNATVSGDMYYRGRSIPDMTAAELRRLRGTEIGIIFQDGRASLTPTMRIGEQIAESFREHRGMAMEESLDAAVEVLARVFSDPRRIADAYVFQISGGMAQRVMIAMATALKPSVIIADEPTANLDPAVRHEMLTAIEEMRDSGTGILAITHDFGVVARLADRVGVMYAGVLVETADVRTTFRTPKHPYTFGLLGSIPTLAPRGRLVAMRGNPPDLSTLTDECAFLPRCNKATGECRTAGEPALTVVEGSSEGHLARCYNQMAVPFRE
jgi:peptide/nickel transport system ATP-binding protein